MALLLFTTLILEKIKKCFSLPRYCAYVFSSFHNIPFANSRQVGFILIGFLLAYWLFCYKNAITRSQNNILTTILAIQIIAGIFSVVKEIKYPFSNAYKSKELLEEIPQVIKL
jgi:branched-subunit amino acid permease